MASHYETIRTELDEHGVLTLTLTRPEIMNAFNLRMMHELIDAFDKSDRDDGVRAVVMTGEGRAFCAGADLSSGEDTFDYERRQDAANRSPKRKADGKVDYSTEQIRDGGGRVTLRIYESLKPILAAVNGAAAGVGATMQLPMDWRIASEKARFGFVFTRRGIVPEACSSWFLPRLVGMPQALDWCYTGRVFDAAEAKAGGLVQELVAPEDLMEAAHQRARQWCEQSAPVSVALSRHMMWQGLGMGHPMDAHKMDSRAIYARGRQSDPKEGVRAFLDKRNAKFADKVSSDMPEVYPFSKPPRYS